MKAIVYHKYGSPDVLKIEDIKQPAIQAEEDGRVLIGDKRIKAHLSEPNDKDLDF